MTPPRDCAPLLEARDLDEMADWASDLPVRHGWKGRTCRELWDAAPRGDWLLDYAEVAGADRRDIVRSAAVCARLALKFVPPGEDRPRLAIEAAERWADEPTLENRRRAERATAAAGAAEKVGAGAAAAAAGLVWEVSWASWAAAEVAQNAAWAHGQAEGPESKAATHRACADAVRRLVPFLDLSIGGAR